ncbi:MAG TPA: hypothetical protein VKS82_16685 [Streptosporangiaceae bacterium]|nr:hypothetical protein [Streptosporangiaceae bacterium]
MAWLGARLAVGAVTGGANPLAGRGPPGGATRAPGTAILGDLARPGFTLRAEAGRPGCVKATGLPVAVPLAPTPREIPAPAPAG